MFVYNGGESEQWVENILDAAGENIPYVLSMMGAAELHEEEFSEGMQGQAQTPTSTAITATATAKTAGAAMRKMKKSSTTSTSGHRR